MIAMSPRYRGAPVPSMIVPLVIKRSYVPAGEADDVVVVDWLAQAASARDAMSVDGRMSVYLPTVKLTRTSGTATFTVPNNGHRPWNPSTSVRASSCLTPHNVKSTWTELNVVTPGRGWLARSTTPWIFTATRSSGMFWSFAIT